MATLNSTSSTGGQASATRRRFVFDVTMDTSYPTGGEAITGITDALAGYTVRDAPDYIQDVGGTTLKFRLNASTKKVQAFTLADVEVTAATNLSGHANVKIAVEAD